MSKAVVRPRAGAEKSARKSSLPPRPHALPELDRVIHERMRLAIVSALAANESLSFNELKAMLGTSDGNLSVHARKLEDAGYVACAKVFRRPHAQDRVPPDDRGTKGLRALRQSPRSPGAWRAREIAAKKI